MNPEISLIFLQGLGNSIVNFPIYYQLASRYKVRVVTFKNGSSDFYKSMNANVIEIDSRTDIFSKCKLLKTNFAASMFPNWKRELFALRLINSDKKIYFQSDAWMNPLFPGSQLRTLSSRHDIENNAEVLKSFNLNYDFNIDYGRELKFTSEFDDDYVVIHPTASIQFKYYPLEFWKNLINRLQTQFKEIHIVSGNSDFELEFCKSLAKPNHHLHAGMNFTNVAKLLANCKIFIGLDSSMMHLASLFRRKVIALWSFANMNRIYPYTPDSSIYTPHENFHARQYSYPKKEIFSLRWASADDIIRIINNDLVPYTIRTDQAKNNLKIFTY